nr:hypothetical protein [uncultured bacterium]
MRNCATLSRVQVIVGPGSSFRWTVFIARGLEPAIAGRFR